jgi:hypothetical protein
MQHSSNEAVLLSLVNEEVIEQWCNEQRTGRKGASNYYSDMTMPDGNPKRERYNGHNSISVSFSRAANGRVFRVPVYFNGS